MSEALTPSEKFWRRREKNLRHYADHWYPSKLAKCHEGMYVLVRLTLIVVALSMAETTRSSLTLCGKISNIVAFIISFICIVEILVVHTSTAFITRHPKSNFRSIALAMVSFFSTAIGFSVFYTVLSPCFKQKMNVGRAIYFSFITIATVGYGDIVPKKDSYFLQFLIILEILIGLYFIAIIFAVLLSLETKPPQQENPQPEQENQPKTK